MGPVAGRAGLRICWYVGRRRDADAELDPGISPNALAVANPRSLCFTLSCLLMMDNPCSPHYRKVRVVCQSLTDLWSPGGKHGTWSQQPFLLRLAPMT